jgi:hypothetical protein
LRLRLYGLSATRLACGFVLWCEGFMFRAVGILIFLVTLAMVAVSPAEEQPLGVLSAGVTDNLTASNAEWHFVVSGDSRNCGDLVMPAIAADAAQYHPAFYWHLGDLRAIYEMDEDYAGELTRDGTLREWNMSTYTDGAWDDVVQMQIRPFEDLGIPFLVGIGSHETILPNSSRGLPSGSTARCYAISGSKTAEVSGALAKGKTMPIRFKLITTGQGAALTS